MLRSTPKAAPNPNALQYLVGHLNPSHIQSYQYESWLVELTQPHARLGDAFWRVQALCVLALLRRTRYYRCVATPTKGPPYNPRIVNAHRHTDNPALALGSPLAYLLMTVSDLVACMR